MDNNQVNFDPVTGQPVQNGVNPINNQSQPVNPQYQQQMPNYNDFSKQKNNTLKIVFMVIGGIVVFFVVLWCVVFFGISGSSKKLVCKSNEGNITIMYTEKQITGYTSNGITYDLDGQKQVAQQIGIESYLSQFESWFAANTTGTCERK